jgi:Tfp pilus assembly protein PilP
MAGCSSDLDDLQARITEVKSRPGGRIEPLPEVKPYETFNYAATTLRRSMTVLRRVMFCGLRFRGDGRQTARRAA